MPRANDNRPVVGTIPCEGCGETATLYQVQRGKRAGYLYKRCGCGADHRTGANIQRQWLRDMTPRAIGNAWIEHPLNLQAPEPEPEPEPNPEPEPVGTATPLGTNPSKPRRGGLIALGIAAGAAALSLITS